MELVVGEYRARGAGVAKRFRERFNEDFDGEERDVITAVNVVLQWLFYCCGVWSVRKKFKW